MRIVFKNAELQKQFEKLGYVKIQVFTKEEIEDFRKFHESLQPNEQYNKQDKSVSYHFSFLDSNKSYKQQVFDTLSKKFTRVLTETLVDYKPLVINFVQKEPGKGEVPVHQNWNFVDETKYYSVSIWCPLVDVGVENGALELIPGTHQLFRKVLRSPSIPWFFKKYIKTLKEKYLQPICVKSGEILIFDDSIIHYSKPNKGNYSRLVIQVIAIPQEAQAKHFFLEKKWFLKNQMHELNVDGNFFLNFKFHITEKPEGVLFSKIIDYPLPNINQKKFENMIQVYYSSNS